MGQVSFAASCLTYNMDRRGLVGRLGWAVGVSTIWVIKAVIVQDKPPDEKPKMPEFKIILRPHTLNVYGPGRVWGRCNLNTVRS